VNDGFTIITVGVGIWALVRGAFLAGWFFSWLWEWALDRVDEMWLGLGR